MSAAYIKSMSLDRGTRATQYGVPNPPTGQGSNNGNAVFISMDSNHAGVNHLHSQSMYNLPGNRRSYADVHHPPPPPYDPRHSSKDDTALINGSSTRDRRALSDYHINVTPSTASAFRPPPISAGGSGYFVDQRRERPGVYESIKERTEPENSASSSSDLDSVPRPKQRNGAKRFTRREVPVMGSSGRDYGKDSASYAIPSNRNPTSSGTTDQSVFNARDSGILDDRSSSHGNSLEGSINAATDSTVNTAFSQSRNSQPPSNGAVSRAQEGPTMDKSILGAGTAAFLYHLERDSPLTGSGRTKKKAVVPSQYYSKENSQGELVVRKRSRGERDRLRQLRQGNRRYTVQGLEHQHPMGSGIFDESQSEPSDSSRPEVPEDIMSVFKNMTKEELLRVVLQTKAQMIRKDQYIKDLENYIDDLLVRVMETTPRLLSHSGGPFHRL